MGGAGTSHRQGFTKKYDKYGCGLGFKRWLFRLKNIVRLGFEQQFTPYFSPFLTLIA